MYRIACLVAKPMAELTLLHLSGVAGCAMELRDVWLPYSIYCKEGLASTLCDLAVGCAMEPRDVWLPYSIYCKEGLEVGPQLYQL